jgi:hypothetical protein
LTWRQIVRAQAKLWNGGDPTGRWRLPDAGLGRHEREVGAGDARSASAPAVALAIGAVNTNAETAAELHMSVAMVKTQGSR